MMSKVDEQYFNWGILLYPLPYFIWGYYGTLRAYLRV